MAQWTAEIIKIPTNLPALGEYRETAVDRQKAAADFLILDVSGSRNTIRWRDGRIELVTDRQLDRLQARHTSATDF